MEFTMDTICLHANKETMARIAEKHGLTGEVASMVKHGLCEVEVDFRINNETGEVQPMEFRYGDRICTINE